MDKRGSFQRKAAIVFFLVDGFSGAPVKSARILSHRNGNGKEMPFVNKRDGYYVLADYPEGRYKFTIQATHYVPKEQEVNLEGERPAVLTLALQHDISSRLVEDVTRIHGQVMDERQQPLAHELLDVLVISPNVHVRLAEEAAAEQQVLKLYCRDDRFLEGKSYFLAGVDTQEKIKLMHYHPEIAQHQIENKLENHYPAGTPLYPLWELKTSANGEFLLPLPPGYAGEENTVEVKAWHGEKTGSQTTCLIPGRPNRATLVLK